jgi:anti-anti-sigma factor
MNGGMAMAIETTVEKVRDGAIIIRVGGALDVDASSAFGQILNEEINGGASHLVLDCSAITHLDTSGLAKLNQACARVRAAGGSFHLVKPNDNVRRVLDITGAIASFRLHDDVETAREAVEIR